MLEVFALALALAADAFAVSISIGSSHKQGAQALFLKTALLLGLYFGIAQGIMPLIGYALGTTILGWFTEWSAWIAFFILVGLGIKMLYEAWGEDSDAETITNISHKALFSLAIATSIDAMAAGFTLNLLSINAYLACLIIALVTALLSVLGAYIGRQSGNWLGRWSEAFGGVVLIGIAINIIV